VDRLRARSRCEFRISELGFRDGQREVTQGRQSGPPAMAAPFTAAIVVWKVVERTEQRAGSTCPRGSLPVGPIRSSGFQSNRSRRLWRLQSESTPARTFATSRTRPADVDQFVADACAFGPFQRDDRHARGRKRVGCSSIHAKIGRTESALVRGRRSCVLCRNPRCFSSESSSV